MRRLRALLYGLPPSGALRRAVDPGWAWNYNEELLATLAELVDESNRMFLMANSAKKQKPPKPIEIRRPWKAQEPQVKAKPTHDEIIAFFGGGN